MARACRTRTRARHAVPLLAVFDSGRGAARSPRHAALEDRVWRNVQRDAAGTNPRYRRTRVVVDGDEPNRGNRRCRRARPRTPGRRGYFSMHHRISLPPEKIGLNLIPFYRERYGCWVGLSDHSATIYPGLAAATMGIDMLEVHVALSREMFGP